MRQLDIFVVDQEIPRNLSLNIIYHSSLLQSRSEENHIPSLNMAKPPEPEDFQLHLGELPDGQDSAHSERPSCMSLYRPSYVLLQSSIRVVSIFIQIHWGLGWFCSCFSARDCLILSPEMTENLTTKCKSGWPGPAVLLTPTGARESHPAGALPLLASDAFYTECTQYVLLLAPQWLPVWMRTDQPVRAFFAITNIFQGDLC